MRYSAWPIIIALWSARLAAEPSILPGVTITTAKGASALSLPLQIVLILTLLTLLPAIIMSVTPFLRITVVLHFLRQALGTQGTPSNQVLLGLALFLTLLIMQPVTSAMYSKGWEPLERGEISTTEALDHGAQPLKVFLTRYVRDKDVRLFLEITHAALPARPSELTLSVLVPAYILSELRTGFQIGAVLFLPFLVIDLVVASITLSIGMVQLPPVMLSAPFKILLFVLVDGWNLVVGSLVKELLPAMSPALAVEIFRQALWTTFWISLPLLAIGLVVGVVVSLLQVATSIQDSSFGAVPRLAAFLFGLLLLLPWMTARLMTYTITLFGDLGRYAH